MNSTALLCSPAIEALYGAASDLGAKLRKQGLDQSTGGVFDTIICVRVLCSVLDLEQTAEELYSFLKPGGKLLVTEHVVNPWRTAKGSVVARFPCSSSHPASSVRLQWAA
jgi:SAM-dependent methyltransferase